MATGSGGYSVTITARDRASATLDQITKRIQRANAPVERLRKSFGNLAASTGIRDLSRELKGAANSASRLFSGVNGAGMGIAALGGGLGVAAMVEGAKRAGAYGNQLYLTAKAAGVGVGAVQRIGNTAAAAGGSFEGATGSLAELNRNMQLYAHSSTQTPADWKGAMGALHINVRNANGQMRSSSSVMDEILRKLAAMKSAQERLYFGNALLGGSFKDSLFPAVARGSAALDRYEAISKHIVHLTPTQVSNLRALNSSFGVLGQNVEGVAEIAYAKLAPVIGKNLDGISAWVERNHQLAGSLDDVAVAFAAIKVAPWVLWALKRVLPGAGATAAVAVAALHGDTGPVTDRQRWQAEYNDFPNAPTIRSMNAPNGNAPSLPTSAASKRTMEQARRYFRAHGWSAAQTAGILANMSAESGFNPRASGDHGTSFGLFQDHAQRARLLEQYARRHGWKGGDPRSIPVADQLRFAQWELTQGDQKGAGDALRRQHTARGAGYTFANRFERPAGGDTTAAIRASSAHLFMPPAQAPVPHIVKGAATVHINLAGALPGTRVSAHSDGDLFAGAPRVTMPMPAGGVP